jgi:glycine/D-amino acid oxidase-like deaminating enzyme
MILDARALPEGRALEAEICIVGAGVVGITLALQLIAAGRLVLMIESGGRSPC